jgi:hypothetical protein
MEELIWLDLANATASFARSSDYLNSLLSPCSSDIGSFRSDYDNWKSCIKDTQQIKRAIDLIESIPEERFISRAGMTRVSVGGKLEFTTIETL